MSETKKDEIFFKLVGPMPASDSLLSSQYLDVLKTYITRCNFVMEIIQKMNKQDLNDVSELLEDTNSTSNLIKRIYNMYFPRYKKFMLFLKKAIEILTLFDIDEEEACQRIVIYHSIMNLEDIIVTDTLKNLEVLEFDVNTDKNLVITVKKDELC